MVFIYPAMAKPLVKVMGANGKYLLAASQNQDVMKIFELKKETRAVKLQPLDMFAMITYKNGKENEAGVLLW